MQHELQPQAWPKVLLGITPALAQLAINLIAQVSPLSLRFFVSEIMLVVICLIVLAIMMWRERRVTLWGLPAIGMLAIAIPFAASRVITPMLPTASGGPPPGYDLVMMLGSLVGFGVPAAAVGFGLYKAREWGSAAALVKVDFILRFAHSILDPGYGLGFIAPEQYTPLGLALIDIATLVPFTVLLPIAVLRANSPAQQRNALLGLSAFALALMVAAKVLHDFALHDLDARYSLMAELTHTFTVRPVIALVFWSVLGAIVMFFHFWQRRTPSAPLKTQDIAV